VEFVHHITVDTYFFAKKCTIYYTDLHNIHNGMASLKKKKPLNLALSR